MTEIACDESGYEGEHLVGGVTDVFVHASVAVDPAAAAGCIAELRRRIRSPALEYKANHLLRGKHRAALEWFLAPDGPVAGHAHVLLVDKTLFAVDRIAALLRLAPAPDLQATARQALGDRWTELLVAANTLLRARTTAELPAATDHLTRTATALLDGPQQPPAVTEFLRRSASGAADLAAQRARFLADPSALPPLDPLLPAVAATVAHWRGAGPVAVVHDRQTTLTPARLARLAPRPDAFRSTDSRADARVQLADFLAGIAGRVASRVLAGEADDTLVRLLRPSVGHASVWPEHHLLGPGAPPRP